MFTKSPTAIGLILFAVLIVMGKTLYPRWFVLLTPAVTIFAGSLWTRIPQPLRIVLFGGWNNLVFVIFFAACLIFN